MRGLAWEDELQQPIAPVNQEEENAHQQPNENTVSDYSNSVAKYITRLTLQSPDTTEDPNPDAHATGQDEKEAANLTAPEKTANGQRRTGQVEDPQSWSTVSYSRKSRKSAGHLKLQPKDRRPAERTLIIGQKRDWTRPSNRRD